MDAPQSFSPEPSGQPNAAPVVDSRLRPNPGSGTLGPDFDSAPTSPGEGAPSVPRARSFGPVLAIAIGVLLAVLVVTIGSAHATWNRFAHLFGDAASAPSAPKESRQLDRLKPQTQAETLLEQAVRHSDGAVDQISSRVDRWQGKVKWNPRIATLATAALNSSDMRVRESGIEVELAAYGLGKNAASLGYLLRTVESSDHDQKIWALWALGLMGNRGVATDRVTQVLTTHLKDSDEDSRHWAVQGLALVGGIQTIGALLRIMHDDPSPIVRQDAACSLAQSGMFTRDERLTAVPQLLSYSDDPALDAQTHTWAFQALTDITHQRLPNDSAAWRSWYESNRNE